MTITITIDFECPRWLRRSFTAVGVPLLVLGSTTLVHADVSVPYSFQSGEMVSSQKINDNFSALKMGIQEAVPVGTVISYFGNVTSSPPTGWLVADGSQIDSQAKPEYASLVTHLRSLGPSYQGASPTKAFTPDLRGVFLRGQDRAAGMNPDKGADEIGRSQSDAFQGHRHSWDGVPIKANSGPLPGYASGTNFTLPQSDGVGDPTSGGYGAPRVASETRPKNVTVVYLIRY